ncbi:MAG: (2Fe-2S)-binding protein [Gemmatimonadaceae bacterium]|nr:(2Fe-2S)-binding protein [Gloeobacterales cyanobacterium ES-bin-141]
MATIHYERQNKDVFVMDESNLRQVTLEQGIPLYKTLAKLLNCGGVGQCGTCIVEVLSGGENLSERTEVEKSKLRRKPDSYRLACQTLVYGEVTIRTTP